MAVATGCSNMLPAISLNQPHQIPNLHYLIVSGSDPELAVPDGNQQLDVTPPKRPPTPRKPQLFPPPGRPQKFEIRPRWGAKYQFVTEEELVIFDLLTKPNITLTKQETAEVKKVAKSLLEKLKQEKLVLDWRKQQTTRAMMLTTVQDILDQLPRKYTPELYEQKCDLVYQHFYEAYMGQGQSVYAGN